MTETAISNSDFIMKRLVLTGVFIPTPPMPASLTSFAHGMQQNRHGLKLAQLRTSTPHSPLTVQSALNSGANPTMEASEQQYQQCLPQQAQQDLNIYYQSYLEDKVEQIVKQLLQASSFKYQIVQLRETNSQLLNSINADLQNNEDGLYLDIVIHAKIPEGKLAKFNNTVQNLKLAKNVSNADQNQQKSQQTLKSNKNTNKHVQPNKWWKNEYFQQNNKQNNINNSNVSQQLKYVQSQKLLIPLQNKMQNEGKKTRYNKNQLNTGHNQNIQPTHRQRKNKSQRQMVGNVDKTGNDIQEYNNYVQQTQQNIKFAINQSSMNMFQLSGSSSRIGSALSSPTRSHISDNLKSNSPYDEIQDQQSQINSNINRNCQNPQKWFEFKIVSTLNIKANIKQFFQSKYTKYALIIATITVLIITIYGAYQMYRQFNESQSQKKGKDALAKINPWLTPEYPYFGDLTAKYQKTPYIIFPLFDDDDNKRNTQIYLQTIPGVYSQAQSLHPRNISYLRPTQMKILTYPNSIYHGKTGKNISSNIVHNMKGQKKNQIISDGQYQEIQQYIARLGNGQEKIIANLYSQLYRYPNQSRVLKAEYVHLSTKYPQLVFLSRTYQKPICIIAYAESAIKIPQRNASRDTFFQNFFASLLYQNYSNYRLVVLTNNDIGGSIQQADQRQQELAKLMSLFWQSQDYHQRLREVGYNNFYFVHLRQKIQKHIAIRAAAIQLCGDGDIVLQIDITGQYGIQQKGFIGRQALALVSVTYDGGYQRKTMRPKSMTSQQYNSKINQQIVKRKQSKDSSFSQKSVNKIAGNSFNTNLGKKLKSDQMAMSSRVVGQVWLTYHNGYLNVYNQNQLKDRQIPYNVTNIEANLQQYYKIFKQLHNNDFSSQHQLLMKQSIEPCFKTYAVQLNNKLPGKSLISSEDQFLTMMQLTGRFNSKSKSHFRSLEQPLCYNLRSNSSLLSSSQYFKQKSTTDIANTTESLQNLEQDLRKCYKLSKIYNKLNTFSRVSYKQLAKIADQIQRQNQNDHNQNIQQNKLYGKLKQEAYIQKQKACKDLPK